MWLTYSRGRVAHHTTHGHTATGMWTPPKRCGTMRSGPGHAAVVSNSQGSQLNTKTRTYLVVLVLLGLGVNTGVLLLA